MTKVHSQIKETSIFCDWLQFCLQRLWMCNFDDWKHRCTWVIAPQQACAESCLWHWCTARWQLCVTWCVCVCVLLLCDVFRQLHILLWPLQGDGFIQTSMLHCHTGPRFPRKAQETCKDCLNARMLYVTCCMVYKWCKELREGSENTTDLPQPEKSHCAIIQEVLVL